MTERRTFETPGPTRLRVALDAGLVRIETGAGAETEVVVEPLRDDDAGRAAAAAVRVELAERDGRSEVVVEEQQGHRRVRIGRFGDPELEFRIRCPHGTHVEARTASADVLAEGRLGLVELRSASGDLRVPACEAIEATTASGDVSVGAVEGRAALRTASGDVHVERAGGPLQAQLVSGDLRVRAAGGGATVRSVSGDQDLGDVAGAVECQSVSGDVRIRVRPGLRLWLDVSSVSGDVSSSLEPAGTAETEGEALELRVRTVSGDVQLGRSTAGAGR